MLDQCTVRKPVFDFLEDELKSSRARNIGLRITRIVSEITS